MPYYLISLRYRLPDGDTAQIDINNVEAADQAAALDRLPELLGRLDKDADNPLVESIKASSPTPLPLEVYIRPVPAPSKVREGRFLLQHSEKHADGWVVSDVDYKVVVTFAEHHFNDTLKVTCLDKKPMDHLLAARIMREMGDWLKENYEDIAF